MSTTVCIVERLTLPAWLFQILPRLRSIRSEASHDVTCRVIDSTPCGMRLAVFTAPLAGVDLKPLSFRLIDVRDARGTLIEERLRFEDLFDAQREAVSDARLAGLARIAAEGSCAHSYLVKCIALDLRRRVLLIQIAAWYGRRHAGDASVRLLLRGTTWRAALQRYARSQGVEVAGIAAAPSLKAMLGPYGTAAVRFVRNAASRIVGAAVTAKPGADRGAARTARAAIAQYGGLNLDRPECNSDVFFWQRSSLPADRVVLIVNGRLDSRDTVSLTTAGLAAITPNPAAATDVVPLFVRWPRAGRVERTGGSSLEARWLRRQAHHYLVLRDYWTSLFERTGAKVYCSWFRYDTQHCAINEAIQRVGGVSVVYARAYNPHPSPLLTTSADVCFGYSPLGAEVDRGSSSRIRYHIAAGFLGDHRFALLRPHANRVRDDLLRRGARRIVAYLDENSLDDARWHTGHEFMRVNYAFVLEKVLQEPWLGLVIKPKGPATLRRRLGPVAELLERALATGRCHLFEAGTAHAAYPPAAAALSADLVIHGHLCAGTAGVEAALAGAPTLLMDREGWPASPLYRLGVGRVVFTDWDTLWNAALEQWSRPGSIPGFGEWTSMLDEIDPFRDGRAAERMGTFIQWLVEGFRAGLDREVVMATAAERYVGIWGVDKITESPARTRPSPDSTARAGVRETADSTA